MRVRSDCVLASPENAPHIAIEEEQGNKDTNQKLLHHVDQLLRPEAGEQLGGAERDGGRRVSGEMCSLLVQLRRVMRF